MGWQEFYRCKKCGQVCVDSPGGEYPTVMNHLMEEHVHANDYVESIESAEV